LDEDNVARQAKALGADAYLVKGLSLQHIVDRLTGVNWTLDTIGEQFDQLYEQIVSRRRELQE
jgi:AmiR/NasT family two-component response regulator